MILTEEERQLILDKRTKEEAEKPKKTGILKENLYTISSDLDASGEYGWLFSKSVKETIIKDFKSRFELALEKGAEFICYYRDDGSESWYDQENYGIEDMSADWAKEHLTNIKNI